MVHHLQALAGNRAVTTWLTTGRPVQRHGGSGDRSEGEPEAHAPERHPLTKAQVKEAIAFTKKRFDVRSQLIIQKIVGADADGDFGPNTAQAVARFQDDTSAAPIDGMVGPITVDAMMRSVPVSPKERMTGGAAVQAALARAFVSARYVHLVADLHDLPVETDALSVHLVESQRGVVSTRFETGGLPVLTLGFGAFATSDTLRAAIAAGLAAPGPSPPEPGKRPELLTSAQTQAAIRYDRQKLGTGRGRGCCRAWSGHRLTASGGPTQCSGWQRCRLQPGWR